MDATITTLTLKRTDQLVPGDVVVHPEADARHYLLPISEDHPGHALTVVSVDPCMLTAGRDAGLQATSGRGRSGDPLFRVNVTSDDPAWGGYTPIRTAEQEWWTVA